jgi:hypothetical protein
MGCPEAGKNSRRPHCHPPKTTMTWTQLHLALNHVPVIGAPFLMCLLAWGLWRRSAEILRLAHGWLVLFSILSIGLKFTGDFAAEEAETRLKPLAAHVERHEQAADQAATGLFVLGLISTAGLVAGRRKPHPPGWASLLVLVVGVLTCVLLARTAHFGGQISHPELRDTHGLEKPL